MRHEKTCVLLCPHLAHTPICPDSHLHRQTPRNFTAATNSGVTHLEYLKCEDGGAPYVPAAFQETLDDTIAQQVHRLSTQQEEELGGLVDCYRKVCKVNAHGHTRGHADRQMHGQTHARTDARTDRHTHRQTDAWTDGCTHRQTDTWTDGCTHKHTHRRTDAWTHARTDACRMIMDTCTDGHV